MERHASVSSSSRARRKRKNRTRIARTLLLLAVLAILVAGVIFIITRFRSGKLKDPYISELMAENHGSLELNGNTLVQPVVKGTGTT